ncbi:hypothetical protein [Endozoicomonas sp. 8E]|uniref:hypothetical protein n=1 Tax=Endozoicomonas sp. 8E TaxID=3035692 RepID=UPI0029391386|nr:hypothetical protein [Endozoicomonas sp. 8E]WOG26935.1 hypothetical protein P6910_20655 [Endozoicomonas sp. 8E]
MTERFIAGTNDRTVSDLPLDDKRHRPFNYGIKINFIDSISWQWLYAVNLLVTYQLILTSKDASLSSNLYPWLSAEAIIVVGWLLKSNRCPDSALFKPLEQQATFMLTEVNLSFAINTMMPGSENNPQQGLSSESPGQQAPQAINCPVGYFARLFYSDSGDGNENPQQQSHTLGLNCFVYPCNGFCQFRSSLDSSVSLALEYGESSADHTRANPGQTSYPDLANTQCYRWNSSDGVAIDSLAAGTAHTTKPLGRNACNVIVVRQDGQQLPCGKVFKSVKSLSVHKSSYHTGQKDCNVTVVGENDQLRPCGRLFQNAKSLYYHKKRYHTEQTNCDVTVVGEDGQQRFCGEVCKSAQSLWTHKSIHHTGQKSCDVTVIGENGQLQPCGQVLQNARCLIYHKKRYHGVQQNCDVAVIREDGQQWPCGTFCKNAQALSVHKSRYHTGQQTCNKAVAGEGGQQRPCGKVLNSIQALWEHKSKIHSGQKTCDLNMVGEDGQQRPCGTVCKNAKALANHKRRGHRRQKNRYETVVREDGQQQSCRKVCKNIHGLSSHNRRHRKRRLFNMDLDDDPNP